jgi:hypothetical protein
VAAWSKRKILDLKKIVKSNFVFMCYEIKKKFFKVQNFGLKNLENCRMFEYRLSVVVS